MHLMPAVDVIKSAMMTDSIDPAQRRYPSIPSAARALWAEGGVARFYRGFSPCLMRAAPANAVMLFTVDKARPACSPRAGAAWLWLARLGAACAARRLHALAARRHCGTAALVRCLGPRPLGSARCRPCC